MNDPLSTVMANDALNLHEPIGTALHRIEHVAIESSRFSIFMALNTEVMGGAC